MTIDSELCPDMVLILAIIFADLGGFAQRRQAALRAHTVTLQHRRKPRVVGSQLRTVDLGMPEVDDAGREAPVFATQAAA
jgi:hypothetical protein